MTENDLETRGIAIAAQMLYEAHNMEGFQLLRDEVRKRTQTKSLRKEAKSNEPVMHWCGKPVQDMTHAELIAALVKLSEIHERYLAIDHNHFDCKAELNSEKETDGN